MLWVALLLKPNPNDSPPTDALCGLATWCLQFGPHVAIVESAVVMEVEQSARLFGGKRKLLERVRDESPDLGVDALSWAPTSLAALALARARIRSGFGKPLETLLDALPLASISAVQAHAPTLERMGCLTLGQVRAIPRGGISRRFDADLLYAMDRAYGVRPEAHAWVAPTDSFQGRLELMARVEYAPAILFGARRLLLQMTGWLAARHCGTTAFTLKWAHDTMRSKDAGEGGELTVRTAEPTRDIEHLCRLLAENLAKVEMLAPAGDLELIALDVQPLREASGSLLPDSVRDGESLHLVLERLAARLGPDRVLRPVTTADHRPEWMCQWQAAPEPLPRKLAPSTAMPQPTFVLAVPLKLAVRGNRPVFQGELKLLVGPQRVEGGWWDRDAADQASRNVARDYWVALSEHAGVLWIYQTRMIDETAWFLHGNFA